MADTPFATLLALSATAAAHGTLWTEYNHRLLVAEVVRVTESLEAAEAVLALTPDEAGALMHESWSVTKRAQGFHGPEDSCYRTGDRSRTQCGHAKNAWGSELPSPWRCSWYHPDLVSWADLPAGQQDINRHAFDLVFGEIRRRAGQGPA